MRVSRQERPCQSGECLPPGWYAWLKGTRAVADVSERNNLKEREHVDMIATEGKRAYVQMMTSLR